LSLEQIRAFWEPAMKWVSKDEIGFVSETLRQQRYHELKRRSCGLVRRYLASALARNDQLCSPEVSHLDGGR
ncbi:MAG: hypothetical protein ABLT11_05795, partial [Candidatus Acidiferrum sp.]